MEKNSRLSSAGDPPKTEFAPFLTKKNESRAPSTISTNQRRQIWSDGGSSGLSTEKLSKGLRMVLLRREKETYDGNVVEVAG